MSHFTRLLLAVVLLIAVVGTAPVAAQQGTPGPDAPNQPAEGLGPEAYIPFGPGAYQFLYLPMVARPFPFQVSGQVTDMSGQPLAGVTMQGSAGGSVLTGSDGRYTLAGEAGEYVVTAAKVNYNFDPGMLDVNLTGSLSGLDFRAVAACTDAVVNGSFEATSWWNLLSGAGYYPSTYSISTAHLGSRSLLTGIIDPAQRQNSESSVRSPGITIPVGTSSAVLRMWLYPVTTEAMATDAPESAAAQTPAGPDEAPTSAFADTTLAPSAYDAQYVRLLRADDSLIATLLYFRSNNAMWTAHQFDLSAYAGQTIKIEVGTFNDAYDGVTAMYVDDVSLSLCGGTPPPPPPPPPPPTCTNLIGNSTFTGSGSWSIPTTAYPAGYTTDYYAASASRSMRTGIPLYLGGNVYSYSDAYQNVTIPAGNTAKLKMYLFPRSEEVAPSAAPAEGQTPQSPPEPLAPNAMAPEALGPDVDLSAPSVGQVWDEQIMAPDDTDTQYVLILNPTTGAIRQTLLWWAPRNSANWQYREFDLSPYAGQTIRIQYGTYNNGYGGRSAMYVDDVYVDSCGAAVPPPPPVCTELIKNGGFENNNAWYIPTTPFSAGYSTWLQRSGARSMRTGIVYQSHNRYAYSDVRQTVSVPNASTVRLRFYGYPMSTDGNDAQYLLVLDQWGYWIDTLVWQHSNASYWGQYNFNLDRFRGKTIMLQWGSYNNGGGGVTSFYVDDVSLQACP